MADITQAKQATPSTGSLQDLIRSIELPDSLPSVVQELKDTALEIVDTVMPDRPVTNLEGGTARAAQHAVTDIANGAQKSVLKGASLPKVPVPAAVAARSSAAANAMAATRGSKFFGGLLKGGGRLLGRLVAPLLFAADVMSEEDKLRGAAKGAGGLLASSGGWMAGSTIGTGIGTMIMPGVGTAVGYFLGGAIGAAVAYGFGRDLGVKGYDKLLENKPAIMSGAKSLFSFAAEKAKSLLSAIVEGVSTHAPPLIEKGKGFMGSMMESINERPADTARPVIPE